ncbi:hypothetical protein D3C81_171170 [compost metagenome]|jgi:hypothetical protein
MDCSIVLAAPERARLAEKRSSIINRATRPTTFVRVHRWLALNDDANTYKLCTVLFVAALALATASPTSVATCLEVIHGCF